jgi:hypothetical protein
MQPSLTNLSFRNLKGFVLYSMNEKEVSCFGSLTEYSTWLAAFNHICTTFTDLDRLLSTPIF